SLAVAGGKAANLGELTRAGLPVPPGFCVTTAAYTAVAAGAGLEPVLAAIAATPAGETARLAELAAQARERLLAAPAPEAIADAVQRMVDAHVAGVLFTANPLTGRRRQAVIDASPGLGEAIVSGAVNPDHFVVDTASGEILERHLGDKRLAIRGLPGGGTER